MATSIGARMGLPLLLSVLRSNPSWRLLSERMRLAVLRYSIGWYPVRPVAAAHRPSLVWRASEYYSAQGTVSKSGTP